MFSVHAVAHLTDTESPTVLGTPRPTSSNDVYNVSLLAHVKMPGVHSILQTFPIH